jgi:hypothetical protein
MANAVQPVTAGGAQGPLTKSDTTTYDPPFSAFYVGGTGDVAVRTVGGQTVTFSAVPVGAIIPISFDRLMSTNTSATLVLGLRY